MKLTDLETDNSPKTINADFLCGDAQSLPIKDESIHMCVCSPPYWGLRDYGVDGQLGLEPTPEAYVEKLVAVFREVRRVLREDGTLWLNLGDSYATNRNDHQGGGFGDESVDEHSTVAKRGRHCPEGLKMKDMIGIPWRVAFALQADGWWLRSDIIWCLSGGTEVYARTQKGVQTTTIKDLARLDPSTVELWNGEAWTQMLGISESPRPDNPIKLKLRSGERIGCTPDHKWPLSDGRVVEARNLSEGDVIDHTELPEPDQPDDPELLPDRLGWLVGYYLSEGSRDGRGRLQFAAHVDEEGPADMLEDFVDDLGGSFRRYEDGNNATMRVNGGTVSRFIDMYVGGKTAKTKRLANACWQRSNTFLEHLLEGYLDGDGHYDAENNRWRLGFTRNDSLASDLRTLCARLGFTLTLNPVQVEGFGETHAAYRGEIRKSRSGHHNEKPRSEIVEIGRSRARKFYDIGVADDPHTFALASGVLTHNCKPNPMPESVTDRPTNAHEHIFLFSKSKKYYYDHHAIKEPYKTDEKENYPQRAKITGRGGQGASEARGRDRDKSGGYPSSGGRNKRDVWTVTTKPFSDAHFAVYPPELIIPCIKAGTSAGGCCSECGAPYERNVDHQPSKIERSDRKEKLGKYGKTAASGQMTKFPKTKMLGWKPSCSCDAGVSPCRVLDPFAGAGTTGLVCQDLGRRFIGVELSLDYIKDIAKPRLVENQLKNPEVIGKKNSYE